MPIEEKEAQRIAAQLIERQAKVPPAVTASAPAAGAPNMDKAPAAHIQSVDIDSMELTRPRSVDVEQIGLWTMGQLNFQALLSGLTINDKMVSVIIGSIIARMAEPSSVLAAHGWLGTKSGLGELLDVDFQTIALMSLYRAFDML